SEVGRGTFVREAVATPRGGGAPDSTDRQRYSRSPRIESSGYRAMDEMYRHSQARGLIPLSVGYPSAELFPFDQMREAMSEALDSHDSRALQYPDIAGLPELVEQLATFSAARGAPEEPGNILVT